MRTRNSRLAKIMRPREKTCVPICVILRFRELCEPMVSFLANSVDPDQPASEEAGCSGSTQFATCHAAYDVVFAVTCFHLLKIANDGNFFLLFGENY